jgi:hypothetical protein
MAPTQRLKKREKEKEALETTDEKALPKSPV